VPARKASAFASFDGIVAEWFRLRIGEPTGVQERAWPEIAAGRHILVTAPTGSGKTLTAFLWSLNQLLSGKWEGGRLRVLYISPLKALNNDIERNLLGPLAELEAAYEDAGKSPSPVRVKVRSGDTPTRERQAILRHPPEILITTPESLNLLLTSPRGRPIFSGLETVILDEVHAVAGSKRGTHLITAVDRLVPVAGEFQRIALSATVRPADRMASFIGGYEMTGGAGDPVFTPRTMTVISAERTKSYEIEVCRPEVLIPAGPDADDPDGPPANLWEGLASEIHGRIKMNRSTLVFANNRRTTERLTRLLNDHESRDFVYSHHGSLSREIRTIVEKRLKDGELQGLVATNSLELGIDIGALDEVMLVKTPPTIASAVQRIGRAGHRVGETSRGRFYPLFGRDLLEAAVVARAVEEHDIEEVRPVEGALDVLAQVVLSITANETWHLDELFDQLRTSYPYRNLSRRQFDLVIEMLVGRYADSRVRELNPRLAWDRIDGTVRGRPGTARVVYLSGGTIPDRGYFQLRIHDSMAKLGELDEEFVWERSVGDTFTLGAQAWKIRRITHNDVLVSPVRRTAAMSPFWRAEERDRSFHLSAKIGDFLEHADAVLNSPGGAAALRGLLETRHHMDTAAASALVDLLERQRSSTGRRLPHRHHLLVERAAEDLGERGRSRLTLHTGWGGKVNRPFAIALAAAWEARYGALLEIEHDNDCLLLVVSGALDATEIFELVRVDNVEDLLRQRLEATGFFGARFRENAGRALLLPRSGLKRRIPLWLQRERGKKLLKAVGGYQDFPVVVETWRSCLQDAFEIERLKSLLTEVDDGEIDVTEVRTETPSPLSADLRWKQTNRLMYEDDTPESAIRSGGKGGLSGGLSGDLLREIVFSSQLRPRLPSSLTGEFESKLQRLHPGYAPHTASEVVEWVKERVLLPEAEWRTLVSAIERDLETRGESAAEVLETALAKLEWIETSERAGSGRAIVARDSLPRLVRGLGCALDDLIVEHSAERAIPPPADSSLDSTSDEILEQLLGEWIRYYGPIEPERLESAFGLSSVRTQEFLESLADSGTIVVDRFRSYDEELLEVCDSENLERLLRLLRARSRTSFEALALEQLPLFLALHQGVARPQGTAEDLKRVLEQLLLWPAPAKLWESEILPARLDPYYPEWLDGLMQESDLLWAGCGKEKSCFLFAGDLDLKGSGAPGEKTERELAAIFPDPRGRYSFSELLGRGGRSGEVSERLWKWTWDGLVTNTTFLALRKGILARFVPPESVADASVPASVSGTASRSRRPRFDRWQSSRPFSGDWLRLNGPTESLDALDQEELNKERVRILLDRYGILFRELLGRELPALRWGTLFRSLRLMELSGEVLSGHFFTGLSGPQFVSRQAFQLLESGLPEDAVFWLNAADPASPCGLGLDEWRGAFPARTPSNHLVFQGDRLVVVSRRSGSKLTISVGADHPDLPRYLDFLKVRLTRRFSPVRSVDVESINGKPAATSPYAEALRGLFHTTREGLGLRLRRRY
jgi:ATP-dependent Lhr-like helicase